MVGHDGAAGALILDARTRASLSQAGLAERAGTTQSAIAAYERGRRQPTLPTLRRLVGAAGYGLSVRLQGPGEVGCEEATGGEATGGELGRPKRDNADGSERVSRAGAGTATTAQTSPP